MTHTQHDFELDKTYSTTLYKAVSDASKDLQLFARLENGLTPDSVKATLEWKAAKKAYNTAFQNLRDFNAIYVKKYKKELAKERKERIAALNRKFQEGNHEQA